MQPLSGPSKSKSPTSRGISYLWGSHCPAGAVECDKQHNSSDAPLQVHLLSSDAHRARAREAPRSRGVLYRVKRAFFSVHSRATGPRSTEGTIQIKLQATTRPARCAPKWQQLPRASARNTRGGRACNKGFSSLPPRLGPRHLNPRPVCLSSNAGPAEPRRTAAEAPGLAHAP